MASQKLPQAVPAGAAENAQLITAVPGLPSPHPPPPPWGSVPLLGGQGGTGLSSWSTRACNPR